MYRSEANFQRLGLVKEHDVVDAVARRWRATLSLGGGARFRGESRENERGMGVSEGVDELALKQVGNDRRCLNISTGVDCIEVFVGNRVVVASDNNGNGLTGTGVIRGLKATRERKNALNVPTLVILGGDIAIASRLVLREGTSTSRHAIHCDNREGDAVVCSRG